MEKVSKIKIEKGFYLFKLRNILNERNISINKIMKDTNTDFKVLKRIMSGDLVKIDIFVLARICDYLNCSIEDIVEYRHNPNKK
ncbi:MAG: helix-turn-helix transcriptional regulator [Bacilli bacterium]|nr:helix-turn-helix transcriptional regulator [Bacilli bacterium]